MFRFRNVAVGGAPVCDGTAVAAAVGSHGFQILQRTAAAQFVHDHLEFLPKLRGIEVIPIVLPPAAPELLAPVAEVHPQMANGTKGTIFTFFHLGIEKARFLNRSGPQLNIQFVLLDRLLFHFFHLLFFFSKYTTYHHILKIATTFSAPSMSGKLMCLYFILMLSRTCCLGATIIFFRRSGSTMTSDSFLPLK